MVFTVASCKIIKWYCSKMKQKLNLFYYLNIVRVSQRVTKLLIRNILKALGLQRVNPYQ